MKAGRSRSPSENEIGPPLMERVECVVVGAGAVGLAAARALAISGRDVVVLERENRKASLVEQRTRESERGRIKSQKAQEAVRKYRDHPAVLMWSIGNEMESGAKDPDPCVSSVE